MFLQQCRNIFGPVLAITIQGDHHIHLLFNGPIKAAPEAAGLAQVVTIVQYL